MMEVYLGAIRDSVSGKTQYVIKRGLDIFRTDNPRSVEYYLTGGWNISAVCKNGVLHEDWHLFDSGDEIIHRFFAMLNLAGDERDVSIHVREYYEAAGSCKRISMHIAVHKPDGVSIEIRQITSENADNKEKYQNGQERARRILDYLFAHNIPQDKEGLLMRIRAEEALAF